MKSILIHPAYFGTISQWAAMLQAENIVFENEDNYQKQTYRNRMYIHDSNGKLLLNIPIKHASSLGLHTNGRQKYRDVQIENDFDWQTNHWRALKTAYQTSPFFEFYEDELETLYKKEFKYLMDFNYECFDFISEQLQVALNTSKTKSYELEPAVKDLRNLVIAKGKEKFLNEPYTQVFDSKNGFIPNLSILDLLFNEGNASLSYLDNQNLDF